MRSLLEGRVGVERPEPAGIPGLVLARRNPQRSAAQVVAGRDRLLQQPHQLIRFARLEPTQHDLLCSVHRRLDAVERVVPGILTRNTLARRSRSLASRFTSPFSVSRSITPPMVVRSYAIRPASVAWSIPGLSAIVASAAYCTGVRSNPAAPTSAWKIATAICWKRRARCPGMSWMSATRSPQKLN